MSLRSLLKGWSGEVLSAFWHKLFLNSETYTRLNNVTLRHRNGETTQIDHVIASRFGVFVIETKTMSGWIYGSERDRSWTQCFPNGDKFSFPNPIRQNYAHAMVLVEVLGLSRRDVGSKVIPIVSFGSGATLKTRDRLPDSVLRGGVVSYIKSWREPVFNDEEVDAIVAILKDRRLPHGNLVKGLRTHRQHVSSVKARHGSRTCPRCKGQLVQRHRRRDGEPFVGCSGFPSCRYTRNGLLAG